MKIKERLLKLEHICYEEPRGMRNYSKEYIHYYKDIQENGVIFQKAFKGGLKPGKIQQKNYFLYSVCS